MRLNSLKYFSTLLVVAIALAAGWWMWNVYMQSPWTRDGKVRAEQVSITPQVSGSIRQLAVKDNQYVHAGDLLFLLDDTPYHIAVVNAEGQLAKAQTELAKANNEANRRRHLSHNYISAEDLDTANIGVKAAQADVAVATAQLNQAKWQLAQTRVTAPVDGWVTNLSARTATTPLPVSRYLRWSTATRFMSSAISKRPNCAIFVKVPQRRLCSTAATKRYRVT